MVAGGCGKRPRRSGPPLHRAARDGDGARVQSLVARGTNINAKDSGGRTALHWATSRGRTEIATQLVAAGADVNARTPSGDTACRQRFRLGRLEIAQLLIAHRRRREPPEPVQCEPPVSRG